MEATLTDMHRQTKRVFRQVQAGQPVRITEHGKLIARLVPESAPEEISLEDLQRATIRTEDVIERLREIRI